MGTVLPAPFSGTLAVSIIPVTPLGGVAVPGERCGGVAIIDAAVLPDSFRLICSVVPVAQGNDTNRVPIEV